MVISHPFFDVIIWEPSSNYKNHYTLTLMDGQSFDMEKQQSVAPKRMQIPHLCDGSKATLHSHLFWWYNGTFQIISATDVSLDSHPEILNWITRAWSTNHFVWGLFHVDANFRYTKSVVFDFTRPRVLGSAPSWLFKPSLWLTTLVWTLILVSILQCIPPYANNQAIFIFGTKICYHKTLDFWRHVASILHCGGKHPPCGTQRSKCQVSMFHWHPHVSLGGSCRWMRFHANRARERTQLGLSC